MGKRLALLHYSAPPVVGGVESVLAHHAGLLAGAGHAVRVLAGRGQPWAADIPFVPLPLADSRHPEILASKGALDAGRVPPDFEALTGRLADALQTAAAGCDLLIAHNVCSLNKNLPLTAALHRLSSRPGFPRLVVWHHDLAWTTPRFAAELHPGYPWDLLRTHWPGVTHVVVSAERQRELAALLGLAPGRIRVVPNGVDVPAFLKLEAQTLALVRRLDLLAAAPLLLLPVRITPRKNIELALHTLAALRARPGGAAARLVVTGPLGPHSPGNADYFAQLQALRARLGLEPSAHFLAELSDAYLPDAVIADFFRLADALFLPSREEGFGIPLLEAAFSRRPVFSADIPALRELGQAEVTYFSPDADPAAIAAVVAGRLYSDPVYQFAVRARAGYTWEQIYAAHLEPLLTEAGT
jgi:mannosylglucosylglycerate synthase